MLMQGPNTSCPCRSHTPSRTSSTPNPEVTPSVHSLQQHRHASDRDAPHNNEWSRHWRTTDRKRGPQGLRQDPEGQTHGHTHDTSSWDHSLVFTYSYLPGCTSACAHLCTHMLRVIIADFKKPKKGDIPHLRQRFPTVHQR